MSTNGHSAGLPPAVYGWGRMLLIAACYLLAIGSIEQLPGIGAPDRAVPENLQFDAVAAFKTITRLLAFGMVVLGVLAMRAAPVFTRAFRMLLPLFAFALWILVSSAWSPLRAYSFGHAMEFTLLVLIALLAALVAGTPGGLRAVLGHACLLQFIFLALLLGFWLVDPRRATILRPALETESALFAAEPDAAFVKNPAEIACVAALGVVLLLALRLMRNADCGMRAEQRPWWRVGFWPLLVFGWGMLYVLQTRSLVATAFLLSIGAMVTLSRGRWLAPAILTGCFAMIVYLFADPYLDRVAQASDRIGSYLQRGQSTHELRGLGGRLENWTGVMDGMDQHPRSYFTGFGYSMATPTGKMWHEGAYRRYTGHNIILDVLAGTGVIGLMLFLLGFGRLAARAAAGVLRREGGLPAIALLMIMFALLSGVFGDSIVGPLDPSSIAVFAVIGCWLGASAPKQTGQGGATR